MSAYRDRRHAGRVLALDVAPRLRADADVVVLGLPRGGVPVAYEVAQHLGAALDVFLVRKLGTPGHEELAMGAIASGGAWVRNEDVVRALAISREAIEAVARREQRELERREQLYRQGRPPLDVRGRTVVLVDDGLATGSSMRAAIAGLRQLAPGRIVVAVPVASGDGCRELTPFVDDLVCAATPEPFGAVGLWYVDFAQVTDAEVARLLAVSLGRRHIEPAVPPAG